MVAFMLKQEINDPILKDIVNRLVPAYKPMRVYLFGSQAKGTEKPDSDYDILIIVDEKARAEVKSASLAYKLLWGISVAVDVLVWTDQEFQKRSHLPNSLPAEIVREGRLPHAA